MALNNIVLMGRICNDIELKTTANGISVTNFAIAVDRKYQPKGEEKKASFIDCIAWRNTAEHISRWFAKGSMIAVVGELQTDTYTDKDGNKRKKVFVSVESVSFCGDKKTESDSEQTAPTMPTESGGNDIEFEEITGDEPLPF